MTNPPRLVSVVIPAFNAERFLSDALGSVRAQTHSALEIIVCDDASTDATGTIAQSTGDSRVRYLRNDRTLGGYGAMNRGVRESRGEFVAIYHADDVYDSRIVERELAYLETHIDVGAVFCLDRFIDEAGREYGQIELPDVVASAMKLDAALLAESLLRHKNTFLRTPSVMFRRSAFDAVGGFDQEGFGIAADLDMWARLSLHAPLGIVREYLMSYRHFAAQWSKRYEKMRTTPEMYFLAMDRHLTRPGVRELVSADALRQYEAWRAQDDVERAANAYVVGDRQAARAISRAVRSGTLLGAASRSRAARLLALQSLVRFATHFDSRLVRSLVYFARFRRLPPRNVAAPSASVTQSLAQTGGDRSNAAV